MPTLTIQLPNLPPVAHILKDETVTIGRMKGSSIMLDHASVSLHHAKITSKNGAFYLKDLNSTNGTMINGQSISEARLQDADRVRFGEVTAQFLAEETVVSGSTVNLIASELSSSTRFASRDDLFPGPGSPDGGTDAFNSRAPLRKAALPWPKRLVLLTPYAGAIGALIVVSFLAWKILQTTGNRDQNDASPAGIGAGRNTLAGETGPGSTRVRGDQRTADLAAALKGSDAAGRRSAAMGLHALGFDGRDAVEELRQALKDSDPEVRAWSALALINNKDYDPATIPVLVEVLHHENTTLRQIACLSLALFPYEGADKEAVTVALAKTAANDGNGEVREAATAALQVIAPELLVRSVEK